MRKVSIVLVVLLVFAVTAFAEVQIGANYHITGCHKGQLLMSTVYMWSEPGGLSNGGRIIGKVSGDGADQGLKCQGAIVTILDSEYGNNKRLYHKIKTILNRKVGWVSYFFIGKRIE